MGAFAELFMTTPGLRSDPSVSRQLLADLERAHEESPARPEIAFALADLRFLSGDPAGARVILERARDLDPTVGEPWLRLRPKPRMW